MYDIGQTVREDSIRKLEQNKQMQDRSLKMLEAISNNEGFDPRVREETMQLQLESGFETPDKFNPKKTQKRLQDIVGAYYQRAIGEAEEGTKQDERAALPLGGNMAARAPFQMDQMPEPPPNFTQMPAPRQAAPLFDPMRAERAAEAAEMRRVKGVRGNLAEIGVTDPRDVASIAYKVSLPRPAAGDIPSLEDTILAAYIKQHGTEEGTRKFRQDWSGSKTETTPRAINDNDLAAIASGAFADNPWGLEPEVAARALDLLQDEANPPSSAFAATRAQMERELGRELRSEELIELDRKLAGGEPLYPVVSGDTVTYVPRSQAAGRSAPRTLYDLSGMPTTAGREGLSTTPPPTLPTGVQDQIAGIKTTLKQFSDVESKLNNPRYANFGPVVGRITLAEVDKLGGAGATKEQIELANALQRLLTSQAFAEGGKQLTPTEYEQFEKLTPSLKDTLPQAIIKARAAIAFLRQKHADRVSMIPERQRGQVDLSLPPPGGGQIPTVRTQAEYDRLPSGAVYMEEDGKQYRKP